MSLTKKNFDDYFQKKTIKDIEFQQQYEQEESPLKRLPDLITHLNDLPRVGLTARIVHPNPDVPSSKDVKAIIKGRFRGMIYVSDSPRLKEIQVIIESYGFEVLKTFFLEEMDEKFTNLSFTIKPR